MIDLILVLVLLAILGGAGYYIYKKKKAGAVCIGCPHSGSCANSKNGGCSCGDSAE